MKVDSGIPLTPHTVRSGRGTALTRGTAFASHLTRPDQGAATGGSAPVGGANLFAALEAVDSQERRRRAVRRGNRLLDLLDELRVGMLSGGISRALASELLRSLGEVRGEVDDPELLAVLDEIDLRAQVELAKLSQMSVSA